MNRPDRDSRQAHRPSLRASIAVTIAFLAAFALAPRPAAAASCPAGARCGTVTVPLDRLGDAGCLARIPPIEVATPD